MGTPGAVCILRDVYVSSPPWFFENRRRGVLVQPRAPRFPPFFPYAVKFAPSSGTPPLGMHRSVEKSEALGLSVFGGPVWICHSLRVSLPEAAPHPGELSVNM